MKKLQSRSKVLAIALTLVVGLTGCSTQGSATDDSSDSATLIGLSGADMTSALRSSDLQYGDIQMLSVCNALWGYTEGSTRSANFDPEGKTAVEVDERKLSLRSADSLLKQSQDQYAEFSYYRKGIAEELLNPGSDNEYYVMLVKLCKKYLKVQDTLEGQYLPSLAVHGGCWNNGNDISAELQEKVAGKWVYVDEIYTLDRTSYCSDADYPWGADYSVMRWLSDPATRSFRIVWSSSNFSSGKSTEYSCVVESGYYETEINLSGSCN